MSTPKTPAGAPVTAPVAPVGSTSDAKPFVFKTPPPFDIRRDPWVCARGEFDYTWYETWDDAMGAALRPTA